MDGLPDRDRAGHGAAEPGGTGAAAPCRPGDAEDRRPCGTDALVQHRQPPPFWWRCGSSAWGTWHGCCSVRWKSPSSGSAGRARRGIDRLRGVVPAALRRQGGPQRHGRAPGERGGEVDPTTIDALVKLARLVTAERGAADDRADPGLPDHRAAGAGRRGRHRGGFCREGFAGQLLRRADVLPGQAIQRRRVDTVTRQSAWKARSSTSAGGTRAYAPSTRIRSTCPIRCLRPSSSRTRRACATVASGRPSASATTTSARWSRRSSRT